MEEPGAAIGVAEVAEVVAELVAAGARARARAPRPRRANANMCWRYSKWRWLGSGAAAPARASASASAKYFGDDKAVQQLANSLDDGDARAPAPLEFVILNLKVLFKRSRLLAMGVLATCVGRGQAS